MSSFVLQILSPTYYNAGKGRIFIIWRVKVPIGRNLKEEIAKLALVDEDFLSQCQGFSLHSLVHISVEPREWQRFCHHISFYLIQVDLKLYCYAMGSDSTHIFRVKPPSTSTMVDLKIAIKQTKANISNMSLQMNSLSGV